MRLVKAKPVRITFWDHCHVIGRDAAPCLCEVIGALYKEDHLAYYVLSWVVEKQLDADCEQFVILKSTVVTVQELKEGRIKRGKQRKEAPLHR